MKRILLVGAMIGMISGSALAGVKVKFAGACENGDFDAQNLDVEYFDLDLDLFEDGKKTCIITTTIPARKGFSIVASQFTAQGLAFDVDNIATLFVNHRFNGTNVRGKRDIARFDEDLFVSDSTFGVTKCDNKAVLRTNITVTTNRAQLLFDQAVSNSKVKYIYRYKRC